MKTKTTITFLFALLISLNSAFSQEISQKSTVSLGVGQSMVKVLSDLFLNNSLMDSTDLDYTSLPAFYLNYDYMVTDFLSVGAAGSFQLFKLKNTETSEFLQVNRANFGIRALFHYGSNDKLDMYSGVRLSTTLWRWDANSNDPTIQQTIDDLNNSKFFNNTLKIAPQIVAFGIRGYFTDMFGAHMELSIGSPYYLSGGINVRF
jgi:hypothetical protein